MKKMSLESISSSAKCFEYVIIAGPIASGKTTLAKTLVKTDKKFVFLDSDELRKGEKPSYEGAFYSKQFSEKIRRKMIAKAIELRKQGYVPVIASTFSTKQKRAVLNKLPHTKDYWLLYIEHSFSDLKKSIELRKKQQTKFAETKDPSIIEHYYKTFERFRLEELKNGVLCIQLSEFR